MKNLLSLPNRLREIRLHRGYTAESLAKQVGTDKTMITRLETGRRTLSIDWLNRLAPALNCSPAEILNNDSSTTNVDTLFSIPVYETPMSTEPGRDFLNQTIKPNEHYTFPAPLLRAHLNPLPPAENLGIFRVAGSPLCPTIKPGDLIITNLKIRSYIGDSIYLLRSLDLFQFKMVIYNYSTKTHQIINSNSQDSINLAELSNIEIHGKAILRLTVEKI